MTSMPPSLWLIGAGPMAQDYANVLQAMSVPFRVIGRSSSSAVAFQQATGISVKAGGLETALTAMPAPDQAVVAVGVEQLATAAQQLISAGCRRILLEKPGALTLSELQGLYNTSEAKGAQVWIAYNRRFYASVRKLRDLVLTDGGITSAVFEFTEWSHLLRDLQTAPGVKEHWLLANSTHVIDLAFDFIGLPAAGQWHAWYSGSLKWHPASARFHGSGFSDRGIPFAYHADWEAPGRWGVELLTRHNRYLLSPMESLQVIPLASVQAQPIELDDDLDQKFKPGLFRQCEAFLSKQTDQLCSINKQLEAFLIYYSIAGYSL
ncbi:Gfo/Idh/MocA family oxidoreductase [Synechococcus lacustris]|uniref:Gfo/Idh/MocA family oxidoreductase n=1 Tax=Synechococcus lacustris TaxID=2116544 RepID=UPI0028F3F094|nr:Gfo/Idh/MocA family oxidoreductase [Synechococcus lacustris]